MLTFLPFPSGPTPPHRARSMRNLFRRTPAARLASCFYCSNVLEPQPPDPRNFVCPACTCRNRYDAQGRVIGDEAAMYQEELNHGAYALRGK